jgi:multisubunit Na+/H+ antiporter MnhE subunit
MNFSPTVLLAGLIFSAIGLYLLKRGKSEANGWMLAVAVALILYPYFVGDDVLVWVIGVALCWLAWYKR